jgi:hypothetical protein
MVRRLLLGCHFVHQVLYRWQELRRHRDDPRNLHIIAAV